MTTKWPKLASLAQKMTPAVFSFVSVFNDFKGHSFNPMFTEQTLPHNMLEESNFNFRYIRL